MKTKTTTKNRLPHVPLAFEGENTKAKSAVNPNLFNHGCFIHHFQDSLDFFCGLPTSSDILEGGSENDGKRVEHDEMGREGAQDQHHETRQRIKQTNKRKLGLMRREGTHLKDSELGCVVIFIAFDLIENCGSVPCSR